MERIKVFVIDDNIAARAMLKSMIVTQDDMEVVGEGGTAKASMTQIANIRPDLILLKVEIADGADLCDIMTEIKNISPDIRVVICAAPNAEDLVIPAAESGAKDFVKKPYNKTNLYRTIRSAVNK